MIWKRDKEGTGFSRRTFDANGIADGFELEPRPAKLSGEAWRVDMGRSASDRKFLGAFDAEQARRVQQGRSPIVVIPVDVGALLARAGGIAREASGKRRDPEKRRERNRRRRAARKDTP